MRYRVYQEAARSDELLVAGGDVFVEKANEYKSRDRRLLPLCVIAAVYEALPDTQ